MPYIFQDIILGVVVRGKTVEKVMETWDFSCLDKQGKSPIQHGFRWHILISDNISERGRCDQKSLWNSQIENVISKYISVLCGYK
ncbi:hypothetical protein XENTR_v10015289 [Xenopus tropicalis]|nr:hypothetical protein XENTR_v10015289 [Xenopus tropicalis]